MHDRRQLANDRCFTHSITDDPKFDKPPEAVHRVPDGASANLLAETIDPHQRGRSESGL